MKAPRTPVTTRCRFRPAVDSAEAAQYQIAYTLSRAIDDVSDIFDVAGASALPQNSLTFSGERGPANFDATHRFSYNVVYDLPTSTITAKLPDSCWEDFKSPAWADIKPVSHSRSMLYGT